MITSARRGLVPGDLITSSSYNYMVGPARTPKCDDDEPYIVVMMGSINLGHKHAPQDAWIVCLTPNGILIETLNRLCKCIARVKV